MNYDLGSAFLELERGLEILAEDPVAHFVPSSDTQARFLEHLHLLMYLCAANKWGKTTIGVVADVAFAQGRTHVAGIALPRIPSPCIGGVFALDYKQQRASVQTTFLRWLGNWPHKAEWDGETLVSVRIKPGHGPGFWLHEDPGDDPRKWSQVNFYSQKNLASGVGFRLHFAHFDEPPIMAIYREVLKAGFPGCVFPTYITATSIKRSQWFPLRAYFPKEFEGVEHNGVMRLRGSVYENTALTRADLEDLERRYAADPDRDARLYGHELDTEGASPFRANVAELRRWLEDATPGDMREWKVSREVVTPTGKQLVTELVDVEFWADFIEGHRYRVVADPSLGIDDGDHDPGEVTVWDLTDGVLVARFNGYLGEYGLAVLSAGLARAYGDALVDPEVGGGYGSAFLSGLRAAGYTRVVNDATGKSGLDRTRIGFTVSADTRAEFVAALNEALVASQQGFGWLRIPSAGILSDLIDLVVDDKGRPVTQGGRHDEGFITAGRIATLLAPDRRKGSPPRERVQTPRERGMAAYRQSIGLPAREKRVRVRPKVRLPGRFR